MMRGELIIQENTLYYATLHGTTKLGNGSFS